ncbi:MAG: RES family NAD+ phosphorylase [Waterburya sp.]
MRVWRICNEKWAKTAFDGQGAKIYGGRWNSIGIAVVYTSSSLALAALESLVHLGIKKIPLNYVAISADIPENLNIERVEPNKLPQNWKSDPAPAELASVGDQWVSSGASVILKVPSAVIDEEWNYLIYPEHPDFSKIQIGLPKTFQFDARLF